MLLPHGRMLFVVLFTLAASLPARSELPAEKKSPPSLDRYGDPLPEGAVARLGTLRWRHDGEVRSLAFSPNGKILAASSNHVILWDVATGERLRTLDTIAPGMDSKTLDFSPDGKTLAVLGRDHVELWDVATGRQRRAIALDLEFVQSRSLCFSPDGRFLAVGGFRPPGGGDIEAHLIDVATGKIVRKFGDQRADIQALAFSPDGKILALGTLDPGLELWDVATGKPIRGMRHPKDSFVQSIAFSPDGKTVASGSCDLIFLSDVATGKELGRFEAEMQHVNSLAFTPDGKKLISGGSVPSVRIWDVPNKKLLATLPSRLIIGRAMALSPDGKIVAMGSASNTVRLWEVASGKELFTNLQGHDASITAIAFTPNGSTLVSAGVSQIRFWDAKTWAPLDQTGPWGGFGSWSLSVSPDGKRLAWASAWEKSVRVCKLPSREEILHLQLPAADWLAQVAFSNHGKNLVTLNGHRTEGDPKAQLVLWDGSTGRQVRLMELPGIVPRSLAVSGEGKTAFVGDSDGKVHWCNLETGRASVRHGHERHDVGALAISPDGRLLLSGSPDRKVRLWEVFTGQEALSFQKHQHGVGAVAFSPDGRLAASAGGRLSYPYEVKDPPRIRLWDVATGEEVRTFTGHDSDVIALAFSPDGSKLVTALQNTSMLVWNLAEPKLATQTPVPKNLDQLWADLAADAPKAHVAIGMLAAVREQSVAYFKERLRPTAPLDSNRVKKLLADLESNQFAVREAATQQLLKFGATVRPALRQALAGKPSLETRRRIERILAEVESPLVTEPETVRGARAVAVLERIGSAEAGQVLEKLATGAPEARLTQEAKASLERLAKRAAAQR